MKDLIAALKGHKILCFLDLEGTQISHEIIEIGAYKVVIRDDGTVKKVYRPYRAYVRAKHRIGSFVTQLTGITENKVKKEGITYREMQNGLKKYMGKDWDKTLFVAYGSQDGTMFVTSAENNMDASMDLAQFVCHRTFDFCLFLGQYIRSESGNVLSLKHACEAFGINFEGKAHDALTDAYNLLELYKKFLEDAKTVRDQYKNVMLRSSKLPKPLRSVLLAFQEGKTVTAEDFDRMVEESLQ